MKKKPALYPELAYVAGLLILAVGTALMEKADFGMSMVVAPAYLLHLRLSPVLPWFSFGVAEYAFQALVLLLLVAVMRRFKKGYLFSFVTAVVYGVMLDATIALLAWLPAELLPLRLLWYVLGMVTCSLGIALLFRTYLAPAAYELFVKELSTAHGWKLSCVKTIYDCTSCAVGVALSFLFFGLWHFEGVKAGTIVCALINGWLIGKIDGLLKARFDFKDGLQLRRFFEG